MFVAVNHLRWCWIGHRLPQDLLGTGGSAEGDFNPHLVGELQRQNDLGVEEAMYILCLRVCVIHTVDGSEIQPNKLRLMLVVFPMIYKVLYIPSGAGFLPSTRCIHIIVHTDLNNGGFNKGNLSEVDEVLSLFDC